MDGASSLLQDARLKTAHANAAVLIVLFVNFMLMVVFVFDVVDFISCYFCYLRSKINIMFDANNYTKRYFS